MYNCADDVLLYVEPVGVDISNAAVSIARRIASYDIERP